MTGTRGRKIVVSGARCGAGLFAWTILLLALVACGGRTTPPGPSTIGGSIEGGVNYLLLNWQEGLRIMIWDDLANGSHFSGGSGSTSDPLFRQEGSAEGADSRGYTYNLETSDGLQANFAIDGVDYDLNQGAVFLIHTTGDKAQVQQLDLDLSGLTPMNDSIVAFGHVTDEIAAFIAESASAYTRSTGSLGTPELDNLVNVVLSNDLAARRELVHYTTTGCTKAEGLGGPPKCAPEQAEGTPVEYLPVLGPGEGVPVLPEAVDETLDFPTEELYAAYRRADEPVRDIYYRPGEYGLFFATGEQEAAIQYVLVHADMAGRIVRLDYLACPADEAGEIIEMPGLACTPEQIMERDAGGILLAPSS